MSCSCALDSVCRLRPKLLRGSSDGASGAAPCSCSSGRSGCPRYDASAVRRPSNRLRSLRHVCMHRQLCRPKMIPQAGQADQCSESQSRRHSVPSGPTTAGQWAGRANAATQYRAVGVGEDGMWAGGAGGSDASASKPARPHASQTQSTSSTAAVQQ